MDPSPFYIAWLRDHAGPLALEFVACAEEAAAAQPA
jgi:hypothetical protein